MEHALERRRTRTFDLGQIDGPLVVCGGIYSSLLALEALENWLSAHGLGGARIIHTGDVVAYHAEPNEASERLRALGWPTIKGNVEEQLADDAEDCGCGYEEGSLCDALSGAWYAYAARVVSAEIKAWMGSLPDELTLSIGPFSVRVTHATPSSLNRFIYPSASDAEIAAELGLIDEDVLICGHSGHPFSRVVGGRLWHNSGALAMPANDGTGRGWFSVLRSEGDDLLVEHHSLGFDAGRAAGMIRAAGLPEAYARAMETGIPPNAPTLPLPMRERQGIALPENWTVALHGRAKVSSA